RRGRRPYRDLRQRGRAARADSSRHQPPHLRPRRAARRALGRREEAWPLRHERRAGTLKGSAAEPLAPARQRILERARDAATLVGAEEASHLEPAAMRGQHEAIGMLVRLLEDDAQPEGLELPA